MTLKAAIYRLQEIGRALPGVQEAPKDPPEAANQFPFVVTYPAMGSLAAMMGWTKGIHTLFVEVHCARTILPVAVAQAIDYIELFPIALFADPTLGGAVDTIVADEAQPIRYNFGRLSWNDVETIGMRFTVNVKIQSTSP